MKSLARIFKYLQPYKGLAFLSILFVFLSALFSLFSLSMVAPFLGVLFGKTDLVTQPADFALNVKTVIHNFNYILSQIIIGRGKLRALVFVGVMVLGMSLLKNFFLYYSKLFMIPIRTGILKELRNKYSEKSLSCPLDIFQRKGKAILCPGWPRMFLKLKYQLCAPLK